MILPYQLPIVNQKKIAEGTSEVSFDLEGQNFSFKPGQYVRITVKELLYEDTRGPRRDFSIASSPNNKNAFKTINNRSRIFQKA